MTYKLGSTSLGLMSTRSALSIQKVRSQPWLNPFTLHLTQMGSYNPISLYAFLLFGPRFPSHGARPREFEVPRTSLDWLRVPCGNSFAPWRGQVPQRRESATQPHVGTERRFKHALPSTKITIAVQVIEFMTLPSVLHPPL